ncbi:MAG: hypothetical protein ACRCXE_02430, partial [Metamycoplasmataceae bacterium]
MKRWISNLFVVLHIIFIASITITSKFSLSWMILPIVLEAILGLLSHFLPNYSTMKFLNFLYDRSFLG